MTRAEKASAVADMRKKGLTYKQIAASLGISVNYVKDLLNDPDGSKARARKDRYRGVCRRCGYSTDGSNGAARAPEFCVHCAPSERMIWTREAIIERIKAWSETYGAPPGARDWTPSMARSQGRNDIAERFYADGCWPHINSVTTTFGSWNAAIAAAGFTPRKSGERGPGTPPAVPLVEAA